MQLSAEWARLSGFYLIDQRTASVLLNLGQRLVGIHVFKKPSDFLTLATVTTAYWAVSATISPAILFPLVHGIYTVETVRMTLAMLSSMGLFVLFNEPLRAFALHGPAIKAVISALTALLGAVAIGYWLDDKIFAAVFNAAAHQPIKSVAFAATNLTLLSANILLPALGGGLVLRTARQVLRSNAAVR